MTLHTRGMLRPLDKMKRKRRPWALILTGDGPHVTTLTEGGELRDTNPGPDTEHVLSTIADDHVIFVTDHRSLLAATDYEHWTVHQRRERPIDARHDNTNARVVFLPPGIFPDDADTIDRASGFAAYMTWLTQRDVYPTARASWSTLGRHLFLSTLDTPVRYNGPTASHRAAFYGGRKQAPFPAVYRHTSRWDVTAAYPTALGVDPLPRALTVCRTPNVGVLDSDGDGLAFAIVDVPTMVFPPLPRKRDRRSVRLLEWPTGQLAGWWTFAELRLARDVGATVTIHTAFEGRYYHDDFAAWYALTNSTRHDLAGPVARRLAKHHANSLWSSFAVSPSRVTWKRYGPDRRPYIIKEQPPGPDFTAHTVYLAAIVAARVRVRLHREALMPDGNEATNVIHCDTDGIITGRDSPPLGVGPGPGRWRHVHDMVTTEIRSPNAYRYTCADCGHAHARWHYSVAGARTLDAARRGFRHDVRSRAEHDS